VVFLSDRCIGFLGSKVPFFSMIDLPGVLVDRLASCTIDQCVRFPRKSTC